MSDAIAFTGNRTQRRERRERHGTRRETIDVPRVLDEIPETDDRCPTGRKGTLIDDLCSRREFARRMKGFTDATPQAQWHPDDSARRIHSTPQEACQHLRRDDTVVDLGCHPPNMIYGFHVAGLLPHLNYVGTCLKSVPRYQKLFFAVAAPGTEATTCI